MKVPRIMTPGTLAELGQMPLDDPAVRLLGGGTLELPRWQSKGVPSAAVYLPAVRELRAHGQGRLGACRTLCEVGNDPTVPEILRRAARLAGTPPIRSIATIGGNVAAAFPGCLAVALLALDATASVLTRGALTTVPLRDLICRPSPSSGEVLVTFTWPRHTHRAAFEKIELYSGGPVTATAAVCVSGEGDQPTWTVAVGGSIALPQRLRHAEMALNNGEPATAAIAASMAEFVPRPALTQPGSDSYQSNLVARLLSRAVEQVLREGRHVVGPHDPR